MFEIVLVWLGLSIVVAVAANTRGRNALGWFFLAALISPLIAGLLVLALPSLAAEPTVERATRSETPAVFVPSGVLSGVPYRTELGGQITAMMAGGVVRFANMDQFVGALSGKTIAPLSPPDRSEYRNDLNGVSYKINDDSSVSAWTPSGEVRFEDWGAFHRTHGQG